jgi:hypothetical protein
MSARSFGAALHFRSVAAPVLASNRRYDRRRFQISIDRRGSGIYRMIEAIDYSVVIGIDPGASGGIAWRTQNEPIQAVAMPATEGDQIELIRDLIGTGEAIAFVEQVGGYTGKGQPGSAMFNFGRSFGFTLGILQTLGVRVELVLPQKWQKPLSLGTATACATRTEWKNKLKSCAQRLYPALKPTLATSDAILILDYALKALRLGTPKRP